MGSSQFNPSEGGSNIPSGPFSAGDISTSSALSGGAHRAFAPTASSLSRRASTLNLSSLPSGNIAGETGSLRGPRPSMSMAQLRPASRPSVQGLFGQAGGIRGVGAVGPAPR